ncbi:MAG: hypothetical protein ABI557_03435 [Aureliella sp.]
MFLLCVSWLALPAPLCRAQLAFAQQPDILAMYLFNGADEATFRKQLENRAHIRVTRIAHVVGLDPAQLNKLQLATHGDLSRFYRELEHVRQKTKGLNPQNQNDMQKAWEFIMPVQQRVSEGIIGDDSLTERVLQSLLEVEQQAKYEEFLRQRRAAQFRSILRMTVSDLEMSLPLTEKQRDELIRLAEGKELPKQAFAQQQVQAYLGFAMLARLTDIELTDLLDKQQLLTFRKLTEQYANMLAGFR